MAYVEWLHKGGLEREAVGGKGASLSHLLAAGFAVPLGFAVTAAGYQRFEEASGVGERIQRLLTDSPPADAGFRSVAASIQAWIGEASLPADLRSEIADAYDSLVAMTGVACAVRSSALSEDGVGASFAGLHESYLNVQGQGDVLASVKRCYASLWSERAMRYAAARGASTGGEAMAVVVMGLVPSETSGIAFTAHPVTGELDRVVINSSWGLGEAIVSGRVTPDSFVVAKGSLALVERQISEKEVAIFPHPDGGGTVERSLGPDRSAAASLSDLEVQAVAKVAGEVERHFGLPQDIEWGMAGGEIYLLQSRPITTLGQPATTAQAQRAGSRSA